MANKGCPTLIRPSMENKHPYYRCNYRCSRTDTRFVRGGLSPGWGVGPREGRNANEVDRTQTLPSTNFQNDGTRRITKNQRKHARSSTAVSCACFVDEEYYSYLIKGK
ncbi:hypothetical protein CDAR_297251 [Caerostris darwini]|uniref:Uncharacterized protein n=1 Tax=Caerostris darwini TaxID=1538125 RepID=A0AAV4PQW9_9ARAC|nr:hypothetical protein CDAR_297251 [Caerostris darwini]